MPNPFNPLDWLKSAQDWFARAERSSGFRPYLIYMLLAFGAGLVLALYATHAVLQMAGLLLMVIPALCFIPLFAWKAHTDPDFCRSESHVQRLKKYELEMMGSAERQIEGAILEQQTQRELTREPATLPGAQPTERGAR